jgi:GTP-binding protein EngB required for normal cell division
MSAPVTTPAGSTQLEQLVDDFVERTVELAREKERDDLVSRLRDEARRKDGASVTVVFAGEAKRGKSSLVNALLATDLSPVDAGPATNAHIVLQDGSSTRVRVFHDEKPFGEDVAPHELESWASAVGNPRNAKHVRSVEIELDHPLLAQGVILVDTPGVGGLEAAHADVTLAALSTADVLVFVLDASAPISEHELHFLTRVTERIGNVVFVMTKIDAFASADEIVAENRRLLTNTRFAPAAIFAVSSTRKRKADQLDATSSELARRLRGMSGFVEFERALVGHAVGRARILRLGNVVQLGRIVLDRLDESEQAVIEGARGNSLHREELETARRRVRELEETRRVGSSVFADEFVTLQDELATDFERSLLELEQRHRQSFERKDVTLEALPELLDAELNALVAQLNASLAEGASRIVLALAATLALEGLGTIDVDPADVGKLMMVRVPLLPSRNAVEMVLDTTQAMGGMYVPERLLGGLTAAAFGGPVGALAGVVAGLAIVGVSLVKRERVRDQQQAQALITDAVRIARLEVPPVLRARLRDVRREVEESVYQAMRRREAELTTAIREHEQMAKEDARTRNRAVAAAANRRATLDRLREQAEELLAQLASFRRATAV